MASLKPLVVAVVLIFNAIIAGPANADGWFFLDPVRFEAEIRFEGILDETQTAAMDGQGKPYKRTTLLLEERLSVGLSGFVVDPRISNFSIEVTPVFRQGRERVPDGSDGSSGNDLDYNINLGFLQGSLSPVAGSLNTFRITSANDIAFGSRNKSDVSEHTVGLAWENAWFPLQFSYRVGSYLQEYTRLGGFRTRREETRQLTRLVGRSSKLAMTLERELVDDKVLDRDYSLNRALLSHTLRWGHNSSLLSNIRFFDREGFNAYSQFNLTENLRINHSDWLSSNTSYSYYSQQSLTDISNHEGIFQLDHSLYNNLNSQFRLGGIAEKSDTLKRDQLEVGANAFYRKTFDFGGVSAGLYGDYRWTDRVSEAGLGETINEEYTADFIEPIILKSPFIEETTIEVAAEDGFIYTEGIDYDMLPFGGNYTEIRIRPSGRITPGDTLLVSYLYQLLPSAKFNSISTGYSFAYDYRWIRFYHRGYRSTYRLISGYVQPQDQKIRTTGLEVSHDFPKFTARLLAETRYRQFGGNESTAIALNQTLGFRLSNVLSINFSGNQVFTDSEGEVMPDPFEKPGLPTPQSSSDYFAFDASLAWFARPNLTVVPSLGIWSSKERYSSEVNPGVDRLYFNAELRVSWLVRQLTMDFYFSHNASETNGRDRVGDRLYFSVRRRFR